MVQLYARTIVAYTKRPKREAGNERGDAIVDETSMPVTTTTTVTSHETLFTSYCIATSSSHPVQGQV